MKSSIAYQTLDTSISSAIEITMPPNVLQTMAHLYDIDHLLRNYKNYSASKSSVHAEYPWATNFVMGHPLAPWQVGAGWSEEQNKFFITKAWSGGYLGTYMINAWHRVVDGSFEQYSNLLVDGQQRLRALEHYFRDRFAVKDVSGEPRYWSELPSSEHRRFLAIPFIRISVHTSDEDELWAMQKQ
ncbi:hypothetical protein [Pseudomonas kurunegalensis]|uniref:hypothetical protein n=1 Tax=Pseudomonas kurunegalensis TaxID=485880 RepID=UPI0035584998